MKPKLPDNFVISLVNVQVLRDQGPREGSLELVVRGGVVTKAASTPSANDLQRVWRGAATPQMGAIHIGEKLTMVPANGGSANEGLSADLVLAVSDLDPVFLGEDGQSETAIVRLSIDMDANDDVLSRTLRVSLPEPPGGRGLVAVSISVRRLEA